MELARGVRPRDETRAVGATGPGPATSDSAVFLASALTAHGDSVLLVDLDFRSADSTRLLSERGVPGISDVTCGDTTASSAAVRTRVGYFMGVGTAPGDLGGPGRCVRRQPGA